MWIMLTAGAASAWVATKVAEGVTGWVSSKIADGVSGEMGRVIRGLGRDQRRRAGAGAGHISVEPLEPPFTSRFATSRGDLDVVLGLRRAFFGRRPVSPDESYVRCWEKNRQSMKIVHRATGEPVGYWAVIPIRRESFTRFIRGNPGIAHAELLADHSQPWSPSVSCLYIVGAVVPIPEARQGSLGQGAVRWRVLTDAFQFALDVMDRLPIERICGYPSQTGGYDVLDLMGFTRTRVCIDGKDSQPVFSATCRRQLTRVRERLGVLVDTYDHMLPVWVPHDRRHFFDLIATGGDSRQRA
jgi:hypothetical protein